MAFTKVTNAGIGSTNTVLLHNLNVVGTVTATDGIFSGIGSFGGNVSIGGVLTYEDVTNVDSVGLITARKGISVLGAGVTIAGGGLNVNAGVSTFGGNVDINANVDVSGTSTFGGDVTIPDKIIHSGDTNTAIRFPSADTVTVETGGTERFRVASDSNITQTIDTDGDGFTITAGTGNIKPMLTGISNRGAVDNTIFGISGKWSSNEVGRIAFEAGADTTNKDDGKINFYTRTSGGSLTSRMKIDDSGRLLKSGQATLTSTSLNHPVQIAADSQAQNIVCFGRASDDIGELSFYEADKSTRLGEVQYRQDHVNFRHRVGDIRFCTGGSTERLRIDASGHMGLGVTPSAWPTNGDFKALQLGTGVAVFGRGSGDQDRGGISANYYHTGSAQKYIANGHAGRMYFEDGSIVFSNATQNSSGADAAMTLNERLRITAAGNLMVPHNHTTGTSPFAATGWYGDDANHYTLEFTDFNELYALKTHNANDYSSLIYKKEYMTSYCDIEFTINGNAPSSGYRHIGLVINGDGSDTAANYDLLVMRQHASDSGNNATRLDKGGGGSGFTVNSTPNFLDSTDHHFHIQIRKKQFTISLDGVVIVDTDTDASLTAAKGYPAFCIYEASSVNPWIKIRDFKIRNYTANAKSNSFHSGGNKFIQISRPSGNTTETFTQQDMGMDDNEIALIHLVVSGTNLQDWGHSFFHWRMPRGSVSSIVTQITPMASGSNVSTFTQAASGNSLVINKDSDLEVHLTVIGGGGRRAQVGW